jgi:hypothetical protein
MYPSTAGHELTEEQARELDDTFLAADPFAYFRSRIASLLTWHDNAPTSGTALPEPEPGSIRAEFDEYLQRAAVAGPFESLDVYAQVAAEALSVRHHAAEALLRLARARLTPPILTGAACLWAEVASGPKQIDAVIKTLSASSREADWGDRLFRALVEPEDVKTAQGNPELRGACGVLADWLAYAAELLSPAEIDLQAGHNKVKHGLAVRARSDMRVMFLTAPLDVGAPVPLSAVNGAVDVFDQPVLELLTKGTKVARHSQGFEITQLRLKPSALLADAYMLAMAHARIFRVAAVEHFAGRDDLDEYQGPPPPPGYPSSAGPRPKDIDAQAPLGFRFPLTTPPGGQKAREAVIGFRHGYVPFSIDYANRWKGRIVDG